MTGLASSTTNEMDVGSRVVSNTGSFEQDYCSGIRHLAVQRLCQVSIVYLGVR